MSGSDAVVRFPFATGPAYGERPSPTIRSKGATNATGATGSVRADARRAMRACRRIVGARREGRRPGTERRSERVRFSISWSRVEPAPDRGTTARWSDTGTSSTTSEKIGLEPVVTLFHYTHPQWFHRKTPWTATASVDQFARFARRVVNALGSAVRFTSLLNEPLVFPGGLFHGQIPPGVADAGLLPRVFDHLMAAHCAAAAVIREINPAAAIGIAHNMMAFAPERPGSFLDRTLVRFADRCYNQSLIEAFATGRWDLLLPPTTRLRGRRDDLTGSVDLFGVNYYSRLHLRCPGRDRLVGDFRYLDASGAGLTDNGWEIVPDAFGQLLLEASQSGLPLVVTENGLADRRDLHRPRFIEHHADAIARVEASGVPIHGYFHWSLLDNYEWLDGFGPKFGLFSVDRRTMRRTPRPSVEVFRRAGQAFLRRNTTELRSGSRVLNGDLSAARHRVLLANTRYVPRTSWTRTGDIESE